MKKTVVSIKNLCKKINGEVILDKVSLDVEAGQIYGIIGRNGSGKSMLFKSICGLITATSGTISVFSKEIKNGEIPENLGALIENPGFLNRYTGFKNLKYLASIRNLIKDEDIYKALSLVGLDPQSTKTVKKYSLGMKQRLGIAQAIMEKPQLLILDEPMNGLDNEGVKAIRDLLLHLKNCGVSILIASHNSEDIKALCDKVYKMDKGILSLHT